MNNDSRIWLRFRRDRIAGGVLSGLAWYLNVHPALPRVIALILVFGGLPVPQLSALVVLAYIAAWLLVPEIQSDLEPEHAPLVKGLYRPARQRLLAGVCLGVARYYKLDVNLVRVVTLALAIAGGVGIVAYIAGWLLMPSVGRDSSET
jgi:phage shock protein PspC (stress-responsive transcriptional regulator)